MNAQNRDKILTELQIGLGGPRPVKAPRGTELHCKGWYQEAALRMIQQCSDDGVEAVPVARGLPTAAVDH